MTAHGRFHCLSLSALLSVTLLLGTRSSAQQAEIPARLAAVGAYLARLEDSLDGKVATEEYLQQLLNDSAGAAGRTRRLRSDLVFVKDAETGLLEIRDVLIVDGQSRVDGAARLTAVLLAPGMSASERARRVLSEGSEFNLSPTDLQISRTLNRPLAALQYLRRSNTSRSQFKIGSGGTIGGENTVVLSFQETASPRLIQVPDGSAARGKVWVSTTTGAVLRTDLSIDSRLPARVRATVRVEYRRVQDADVWWPASMNEDYTVERSAPTTITTTATYSNYRTFTVTVDR